MAAKRDALRLVRPHLAAMPGYKPMDSIDVVAGDLGVPEDRIVKLDGNENPYGPSPKVTEALGGFGFYHLYPDPEQRRVREAVAEYVGVDASQIVMGNGSDELLSIAAMLFLSPGDTMANAPPTFGVYTFLSHVSDARIVQVERNEDFGLDLPALERALDDGAKLLFIASPNYPTGDCLPREQLERLLAHDAMIVVDEAWADFLCCGVGGPAAKRVRDRLAEQGIMVRYFDSAGLRNCIRISVGKAEHSDRVIGALKGIGAGVGK